MMDCNQKILARAKSLQGPRPSGLLVLKEQSLYVASTNCTLKSNASQPRPFSGALRGGHDAERKWVEALRTEGRSVAHGKKLVIKRHNKNTDHLDTPDAVALLSVEIKERRFSFTCPEDWPYPTVIVDDLRGMARETLRHFAYVYISRTTGEWVWLCGLDRNEDWREETTFDRGRGHEVPVLTAPKSHLRQASQLKYLIYPHNLLELVDGATHAFRGGGGATEETELCPTQQTE